MTLLESAKKTQSGIINKTCEISIASKHNSMIMLFKDFGRKIPLEIAEQMFSGKNYTQDYGGGYHMYRIKNLLRSVGVDIKINLNKSKYTVFFVDIPFDRNQVL